MFYTLFEHSGLHYIHIFSMLAKFYSDQRSIVMSSINCLNSSFCSLKYYIKDEFMDHMVNNIQLACLLSIYRACNSMVGFLIYELYNKLLDGVILLKVTSDVTWT